MAGMANLFVILVMLMIVVMVRHGTSWHVMARHGTSWYVMSWYVMSWYVVVRHGTSWYVMVHHGTSWYVMVHHGRSWYVMVRHVMVRRGTSWYMVHMSWLRCRPGTLRQLQVGPTALISLLTGQALDAVNLSPGVAESKVCFIPSNIWGIFISSNGEKNIWR